MSQERDKHLGIVRGDLYAKRDPRPWTVRQCALEMRERIAAGMLGKRKGRALRSVQAGITNPSGAPMKLAAALQDARVSYDEAHQIVIVPQARALARLYGRNFTTGDFLPPAPAVELDAEAA
jgi:hypothetical protein